MAWDRKAPYDCHTGKLQEFATTQRAEGHYDNAGKWHMGEVIGPIWRDVEAFEATMTLVTYGRGRSSITFYWRDERGQEWPMFLTDAFDLVNEKPIVRSGLWIATKRGQNYAIMPTEEAK